jgi:hypothetical protein
LPQGRIDALATGPAVRIDSGVVPMLERPVYGVAIGAWNVSKWADGGRSHADG